MFLKDETGRSDTLVAALKPVDLFKTLQGMEIGDGEKYTKLRLGAVLVIFAETEHGPGILFTKRAANLAEHAGQISFPGGAVEKNDESLQAAAYRETWEEVGIEARELDFIAPLPLQPVLQSWLIHPFAVWWAAPRPLNYNLTEVDEVLLAPLSDLVAQHQEKCWLIPDPEKSCRYRISGELLWGATARITGRLLDRLKDHGYF